MEISYMRQHNDSFMVLNTSGSYKGYETQMISHNKIGQLLEYKEMDLNGSSQCWYNISKKESLEDYVEARTITVELLEKIIMYIYLALEETDKYLINPRHIYLSKETAFLNKNRDSFSISLCYCPDIDKDIQTQFREIMEYLIRLIPGNDKRLAELAYRLYDLCMKEDYTLLELIEEIHADDASQEIHVTRVDLDENIDDISMNQENSVAEAPVYQHEEVGQVKEEYMPTIDYLSDYYEDDAVEKPGLLGSFSGLLKGLVKKRPREQDMDQSNYKDFVVDPDFEYGERTVLLTEQKPVGKLVYDGSGNQEDFIIEKDVFRIGSSKATSDAVIRSRTVSGNHAKITKEGDDYYITDLNSSNGTYVNGNILNYREKVRLKTMDSIKIADVGFIFM